MGFNMDNYNKAESKFQGTKELYPEGIVNMTITELKPWADKNKGFGIRLKGDLDKTLYLGFSYQYSTGTFKVLNTILGVAFNGKVDKNKYVGQRIGVKIKHEDRKGITIDEDNSVFNLKEYNDQTGSSYKSIEELEKAGVKTFSFQQEKITDLEEASEENDLLNDFDAGFDLDEDAPF